MWHREPEFMCYQKLFDDYKDKWLEPIGLFTWNYPADAYWFQGPEDKEPWKEEHPSHVHHYNYLNEIVRPSLGIEKENCDKQKVIHDQLNKYKKEIPDLLGFEQKILDEMIDINVGYIGF